MAEAARIRDPRSGGTAKRTGRDACRRVMDNPCRQQIRSRGPIPNGSVLGSRPPPELRDSALVECLCGEDDFALKIRGQTGEFPILPSKIASLHLPNLTDLICRLDHRLSRFARKCLGELRHVYDHAVDTIFCRRMWIGNRADTEVFRTLVGARPLSEADEESLIGGEAINGRE